MRKPSTAGIDLEEILRPESDLERAFLNNPLFIDGLYWGVPRYGHPEGQVYKHVAEVLSNIDKLSITPEERYRLRIITYVHDTFKNIEDKNRPRDWNKHHAALARNFLEQYTDDPILLTITHWHDEAYYVWRDIFKSKQPERGYQRLDQLLTYIEDFPQLYYLFFKCDTQTGDKNPAPLKWVEEHFPDIEVVLF